MNVGFQGRDDAQPVLPGGGDVDVGVAPRVDRDRLTRPAAGDRDRKPGRAPRRRSAETSGRIPAALSGDHSIGPLPILTPAIVAIVMGAGALAGCLGALLGLGGGVFLVPFLNAALGLDFKHAAAISLVTVIATSSAVSAGTLGLNLINLRLGMLLEVASAAGGVAAAITIDPDLRRVAGARLRRRRRAHRRPDADAPRSAERAARRRARIRGRWGDGFTRRKPGARSSTA